MPKNRINRVHPGGFYGNMFGYTSITNSADSAMEPPMVWISLTVPGLAPAQCYELLVRVRGADGTSISRSLHGTIHKLAEP